MNLERTTQEELIELLAPLLTGTADRQALLSLAFGEHSNLRHQIDTSGPVSTFLPNLIVKLTEFGEIEPGKPALGALLEAARGRMGVDNQARVDALLHRIGHPVTTRPRFRHERVRALNQALREKHRERKEWQLAGKDTAAIDAKILDLKRKLRERGLEAGDILCGRFELHEQIGHGGFSTVWKAYDEERQEVVAVKVLHHQYARDETRRERFVRGAKRMAALRHPGIVQVVEEALEDGGYHFFVMKYAAGGDLRQVVLFGKCRLEERIGLILEVGRALRHAHEQGLVHRDVKPANILLDGQGQAKLTDFDLVRAADSTGGTRTGMLGTFVYAAPEQLEQPQEVGAQADVYGLGMTAVFVLQGADLSSRVLRDAPGVIGMLDAPDGVKQVLERAVSWEPEERHDTVAEFCRELEKALSDPVVVVQEPGRPEIAALLQELDDTATSHERRAAIGDRLAELGDTQPGVGLNENGLPDIVWCDVPEGEIVLEDDAGRFQVRACQISKYLLTWKQYRSFLEAEDGYRNKGWWKGLAERNDQPGEQYFKVDNRPAEGVSWYDAVAFCRWFSVRLDYEVRLPTEWEWQQAATGGDSGNVYPWGEQWGESRANTEESGLQKTTAVGVYPQGASPLGVLDIGGNVWEWCLNKYDEPEDISTAGKDRRVVRGGGWLSPQTAARAAFRALDVPGDRTASAADSGWRARPPDFTESLPTDMAL